MSSRAVPHRGRGPQRVPRDVDGVLVLEMQVPQHVTHAQVRQLGVVAAEAVVHVTRQCHAPDDARVPVGEGQRMQVVLDPIPRVIGRLS